MTSQPEAPRSVFAQVVLDKLDHDRGGPLAGLRDHHVKWMLEFTKFLFACPASSITIDVDRKKIFLHPATDVGLPLSETDFKSVKGAKDCASRIPINLNLAAWTVSFKRVKAKRAKTVE